MGPERQDSPENVREIFDELERACFMPDKLKAGLPPIVPELFRAYRRQCEARWDEGRSKFGQEYLARDNNAAGREEYADGANYAFSDCLQNGGIVDDREVDLVKMEMFHAWKAFEYNCRRAAKRRGSP